MSIYLNQKLRIVFQTVFLIKQAWFNLLSIFFIVVQKAVDHFSYYVVSWIPGYAEFTELVVYIVPAEILKMTLVNISLFFFPVFIL
jgi:hypothetical protein